MNNSFLDDLTLLKQNQINEQYFLPQFIANYMPIPNFEITKTYKKAAESVYKVSAIKKMTMNN